MMVYTANDFRQMRTIRKKQRKVSNLKIKKNITILTICISFVIILGFMITTYAGANNTTLVDYRVKSGDTLWTIAENYIPEGKDIREYIYNIKKINDLDNSMIYSGQKLIIPTYK